MTKLEFMKELESLLSDIPLEERDEALQYYNGYFEDAGDEHEEEIIKELVSPKRVAATIKADLVANAQDRENQGYFTEKGYQDTSIEDEKYELVGAGRKNSDQSADSTNNTETSNSSYHYQSANDNSHNNTYRNANSNNNGNTYNSGSNGSTYDDKAAKDNNRNTRIALIVVLCFFGWPFLISAFGILIGVLASIIGIIIGFGVAGIVMIITGIALVGAGIIQFGIPLMAILFCGSGLLVFGLGMLFTLVCVVLCKNVLPAIIRGVVNLCRRPFQNRSVTA